MVEIQVQMHKRNRVKIPDGIRRCKRRVHGPSMKIGHWETGKAGPWAQKPICFICVSQKNYKERKHEPCPELSAGADGTGKRLWHVFAIAFFIGIRLFWRRFHRLRGEGRKGENEG